METCENRQEKTTPCEFPSTRHCGTSKGRAGTTTRHCSDGIHALNGMHWLCTDIWTLEFERIPHMLFEWLATHLFARRIRIAHEIFFAQVRDNLFDSQISTIFLKLLVCGSYSSSKQPCTCLRAFHPRAYSRCYVNAGTSGVALFGRWHW